MEIQRLLVYFTSRCTRVQCVEEVSSKTFPTWGEDPTFGRKRVYRIRVILWRSDFMCSPFLDTTQPTNHTWVHKRRNRNILDFFLSFNFFFFFFRFFCYRCYGLAGHLKLSPIFEWSRFPCLRSAGCKIVPKFLGLRCRQGQRLR